MPRRVVILGAAGRDFHNFNVFFRDNPNYEVVAFTQTEEQTVGTLEATERKRFYPPSLAGKLYPNGIPIVSEKELPELIEREKVDLVCFAYSDVSHEHVMHLASIAMSKGAGFLLLGPKQTMLKSKKPVIAVTASRTGAGKSSVTRKICSILEEFNISFVVVRHPMPYGDLEKQRCQRFASFADLDKHNCTIEEREEYEPLIARGYVVYAGVDYSEILKRVEEEAEVIIWDGGNNDYPFFMPDLWLCVCDAFARAGEELRSFPGEVNFRAADVIVINKVNTARPENVELIKRNAKLVNPSAKIILSKSEITIDEPNKLGERILLIEDGPTATHGSVAKTVGLLAIEKYKIEESRLLDPREFAVGSIRKAYELYPHLGKVLPALGYSESQLKELEATIKASGCDSILLATQCDLRNLMRISVPVARVSWEVEAVGKPTFKDVIEDFLARTKA